MTCSKIFSGDLPELTNEIIHYLRKDFSTLHSCILVNRLWCRLAIPLLWENPFSISTQNYRYIEIYLHHLNEDVKSKFNKYGIDSNLLTSNTLFNYPSLIKYLNISSICFSINKWVGTLVDNNHEKLDKLVYRSLFELFIENEGNLHSFEIAMSMDNDFENFNDTMELILQNQNFTYNIRNLEFHIYNISLPNIMNIIPFLKFLSSNCNLISSIVLNFPMFNSDDLSLIENCVPQIIISQRNLKKISFGSDAVLYNPFLSLKNSNCTNTLNTIVFDYIDFRNIINILQEAFDQLKVLESIHILYCYSLNSDFVQQIISVKKPFELKSLFMNEILRIESLQSLLQKFGDSIENFGFGFMSDLYYESKQQLIKLIMKYCTKIKYFDSGIPDDISIYLLIENVKQIINYLTIEIDVYNYNMGYDEFSSFVLQNLGQVLPPKLEYLCLTLSFNTSDLETFLENSQNTFIKKLLIRNVIQNKGEAVFLCLKEYIIRKERIRYLAFLETIPESGEDSEELFSLKNEVNEFKLYNIIVQKYYDLYITANNFIDDYS
ncbi:hypothetical protein RclHR1_05220005 [Rhizophagus clarus]|uniref:F-box domain-containing protein n=1 Tax=Rhizophagus clarus TaxID=94130 RepID=A0A2Z6RL24_9GLOM|nr:hypothetical protein RclHR1_05220005 [Rhizophagus clarus]GES79149.1 hypothetical protein GLOIN_2v1875654 [Rhizophagus clarus]